MDDYRVELDVFSGPLDLLLYLIKRHEVDIHDIPVSRVADQYHQYVQSLRALDIDLAGEYLVMAATLVEIKSAMLRPHQEDASDDATPASEDPTDPRYELVQQLLAYKRFKDLAAELERRREVFSERFPLAPAAMDQQTEEPRLELEDVQIWDLVEAFNRLMEQTAGGHALHEVVADDTPIELHAADIADRLQREGPMPLDALAQGRSVNELVGLFLALLELVRDGRLRAWQVEFCGPIHLQLREPDETDPDDAEAALVGQPDPRNADHFEWPDEATRQRYIRRQKRRSRGERIEEDEQFEEDLRAIEAEENAGAE